MMREELADNSITSAGEYSLRYRKPTGCAGRIGGLLRNTVRCGRRGERRSANKGSCGEAGPDCVRLVPAVADAGRSKVVAAEEVSLRMRSDAGTTVAVACGRLRPSVDALIDDPGRVARGKTYSGCIGEGERRASWRRILRAPMMLMVMTRRS